MCECKHHGGESFSLGVLLGALIGAGAGLLLAPSAGDETREALKVQGKKVGRSLKKKLEEAVELTEPYLEEWANQLDDVKGIVNDGLEEARDTVGDMVEEKSREVKKEVKRATRPVKKLFK